MAIAGVEPVELLSTLGKPEVRRGETIRALLYEYPSGEYEYYTTEKVREILIKFANSKNAMRRDMPVYEIVDEFMEGGEEE